MHKQYRLPGYRVHLYREYNQFTVIFGFTDSLAVSGRNVNHIHFSCQYPGMSRLFGVCRKNKSLNTQALIFLIEDNLFKYQLVTSDDFVVVADNDKVHTGSLAFEGDLGIGLLYDNVA